MRIIKGNTLTEYVVVTLIVTLAVFAPILPGGQSLAGYLIESIKDYSNSTAYLISLP